MGDLKPVICYSIAGMLISRLCMMAGVSFGMAYIWILGIMGFMLVGNNLLLEEKKEKKR